MRKVFFMVFGLLVFSSLSGQEVKPEGKWSASLTGAFIPLPEFNFGVQPGLEYRFTNRLSLLTEITIRIGNSADKDAEAINKKYFRIQPEVRYNFYSKKRNRNDYAGLRMSWATRKFDDINRGFYATSRSGDDGFYYDQAKITSPVITSSLQVGTVFPAGTKVSVDMFLGLGVRFITTDYTDVVNAFAGVRTRPADGRPVFYASYSYEDQLTWFHMNAGIRGIYHFR